ncbi:unnamed protein product [Parajaminaea phylloscopi]
MVSTNSPTPPRQNTIDSSAAPTPDSMPSAVPAGIPPSSLPPGQPAIRMTDSQSGPNGPNLKFAALSVESYHLDSPPFTGTAVGSSTSSASAWDKDQLDQAGRDLAATNRSSPNGHAAPQSFSNAAFNSLDTRSQLSSSRASDSLAAPSTGRSIEAHQDPAPQRRQRQPTDDAPVPAKTYDSDVPSWDLDARRRGSASGSRGGLVQGSSSAQRHPQPSASTPSSSSRSIPQSTDSNRPLHTQLTDDIDGLDHQHEPDQEVDGDGHGFVLRQQSGSGPDAGEQGASQGRVPVQSRHIADYSFPRHRLPLKMRDESKIPLVIVACGSFSPPTYLHLRIFEMAKDQVIESGKYELLAGYYSPVSDHYRKAGLAPAIHRVRMCELAVEKTSTWLMVDAWESLQNEYQRTAVVLDHFNEEINGPLIPSLTQGEPSQPERGVLLSNGRRRRVKIMLLAGGDLIQSMGEPGVWADADLHHILGRYGCMIVERTGADVWSFLLSHDLLWRYRPNLRVVKQTIYNDISSSKVRLFVRRGQSIKYLLPNSVIKHIETHKLYRLPADEERAQPASPDEDW